MAEVKEAVKNLKTIGSELTIWENRMEFAKTEAQKAAQTRDALQAEIDKKSSDFAIYIAQRDAEIKKSRADMMAEREGLEKNKAEFQDILKQHQADKNALIQEKRDFEIQKLRQASSEKNVQEFITAVRRACGLLGI